MTETKTTAAMDTSDEVPVLPDIAQPGVPEISAELAKIGCCPRCTMRLLNIRSYRAFEADNKVREYRNGCVAPTLI
jgi:hypothetical protein